MPLAQCGLADSDASNDAAAEDALRGVLSGRDFTPDAEEFRAAILELGRYYYESARFSPAIEVLQEAASRFPKDPQIERIQYRLADSERRSASEIMKALEEAMPQARREELEHRRKVEEIIDFLDLQSVRKATAGTLPYGLRKRVELARAMALEPQLILLDEPMAGMNFEEKEDMARYIVDLNEEFGMTVVMIEHDMGVVMDISHRVTVLDFGRKIAEGDPATVLADPHVKRAYLGEEDEVLVDPDDKPAAGECAA